MHRRVDPGAEADGADSDERIDQRHRRGVHAGMDHADQGQVRGGQRRGVDLIGRWRGAGRSPAAHRHQGGGRHQHHERPGQRAERVDRHEPVGHRPGQRAGIVQGHRVPGHRRRVAPGPQRGVDQRPGRHRHHGGEGHRAGRSPPAPPAAGQRHDEDRRGGAGGQADLAGGDPGHDQCPERQEAPEAGLVEVAVEGDQRAHREQDEERLGPGHSVGQEQVGAQQEHHRQPGPPWRAGPAGHGHEGQRRGEGEHHGVQPAGHGEHVLAGERRHGGDDRRVQGWEGREGDALAHHDRPGHRLGVGLVGHREAEAVVHPLSRAQVGGRVGAHPHVVAGHEHAHGERHGHHDRPDGPPAMSPGDRGHRGHGVIGGGAACAPSGPG